MDAKENLPPEVADMVQMARQSVKKIIGIEPDLTPETMPLVDEYLRQMSPDAPEEVQSLLLAAVGCYFGEVLRRLLNGRWALRGPSPAEWHIELEHCFLHLNPVGMAGEVFTGVESEKYDGSFATLDELRDGLAQMLQEAAPLSEEEYYSLSGRIDILQLAVDWLTARQLASGKPMPHFTPEDYRCRLEFFEEE
jgi:hypothetical protein